MDDLLCKLADKEGFFVTATIWLLSILGTILMIVWWVVVPEMRPAPPPAVLQDTTDALYLAKQGRSTEDIIQIQALQQQNAVYADDIMTLAKQGRATADIKKLLELSNLEPKPLITPASMRVGRAVTPASVRQVRVGRAVIR